MHKKNLIPHNYYYNITDNIYYKCHQNCYNCTEGYNSGIDNMNCISCKNDTYRIYNDEKKNCYNRTSLNERFYFKENMFYPCYEKCLTCSEGKNETSDNCLSCDNNNDLYLLEDLNNCENKNHSGYYLDNVHNILKRCYLTCKTCNGQFEKNAENIENHNCIECADNY